VDEELDDTEVAVFCGKRDRTILKRGERKKAGGKWREVQYW
jgi:hypothetical protein